MDSIMPLLPSGLDEFPALRDDTADHWVSYAALRALALEWATRLEGPRALVFLYLRNEVASVAALLGAAMAGHAIALFDPALPESACAQLEACYRPDWILRLGEPIAVQGPLNPQPTPLDPALGLLLSTSGSTGSPKLVRLSWEAIASNARAIADVLDIRNDEVGAGYLPLHYSYGLSVLSSHMIRGARVVLTERGLTDRAFWPTMRDAQVTHFPGVPFHYQILSKLGFARLGLTALRTLTQAGGALDLETRRQAHAFMNSRAGRFYVLYGQTEAAPRMTTLQHSDFPTAETSVGTALPGCRIEIANPGMDGAGEVVFHGPNVMLGYAEQREDLLLGDVQCGRLPTGDVGRLDDQARLYLTGRVKRFGKVYGLRVNLDEIEHEANAIGPAAVIQVGEIIRVYFAVAHPGNEEMGQELIGLLLKRFTLPRASYQLVAIANIPRTERGKVDYRALEQKA